MKVFIRRNLRATCSGLVALALLAGPLAESEQQAKPIVVPDIAEAGIEANETKAKPVVVKDGVGARRKETGKEPPTKPAPNLELKFFARSKQESASKSQPIWPVFERAFRNCSKDCIPWEYHAKRPSYGCHSEGRALDLHAIKCGGKVYKAISEAKVAGKFTSVKSCIARQKGIARVLWHNGRGVTEGHYDHAHISLGCRRGGGRYW